MVKRVAEGLAPILKALRAERGLTQQQLAGKAGLSISLVTQVEQGSVADPRLSTLIALAGALGVSADRLVAEVLATPAAPEEPAASEGKGKGRRKKGES